jgi:predicted Zn-ribbon and HTH transcriptional regulator
LLSLNIFISLYPQYTHSYIQSIVSMIFKQDISPEFAKELFDDADKVLKFIAEIKWKDGFVCRNCGHTNFCDGKTTASRRCTRCKKEESAAANTIFHNIKFPINKAFYIAYNVCVLGKDFSSYNYSDQLGLNQMTCWKFRKRIQDCIIQQNEVKGKVAIKTVLMSAF